MFESYPTRYRDEFGEETTTIQNDGYSLRMALRGVEFQGCMFDDWEPTDDDPREQSFSFSHGMLCSYAIDCEIPVPVVEGDKTLSGILRVHLDLGAPRYKGGVDSEVLKLELILNGRSFKSCGKHGWFEDELLEIHTDLPAGTYIKSCFSCAFSDYGPAGNGLFGCMACFRNTKQEYLSLKGKAAYFQLSDQIAEIVQETYLCPEFEKRVPGTGYRG